MSFWFNEAGKRMFLPVGFYGPPSAANALALNLADAAAMGNRLKADLYVANSSFVATADTLMDITSIASLQAVTGLALHQGASYASKNVTAVTAGKDDTLNKVTLTPAPTSFSWIALEAATAGYTLRAIVIRYDNGAGIDLPVYWFDGGNVIGMQMLGGDVNVSLPQFSPIRSLAV